MARRNRGSLCPMSPRERIGWVDALRVLACFMVVLSHCCDGFIAQFNADYNSFLTGTIIGSLVRPCVPLFAMMSGILLLPLGDNMTLSGFYRKRVGRILVPLIFWSMALPVLAYLYFTTIGAGTMNPAVDLGAYTTAGLGTRLWTWILNFNYDTTPLWYLYMLLGLYLIMPILSAWLKTASKKDIQTILFVWGLSLLVPYIKLFAPACGYLGNYGNMDIFGGCDWNVYTTFYYVSGFLGYLILAYYLKTYTLRWSSAVLTLMFIAGYAMTAGGYIWIQSQYPGDYAYLEIVWLFCGINVFMMTLPVFVGVQRLAPKVSPLMSRFASLTFGIYLCHFFFIMVSYDLFDIPSMPYVVRITLMSIVTFLVSALLTLLLKQSRFTSRLID